MDPENTPVEFTAKHAETLDRIAALLEKAEPMVEQFPEMLAAFAQSPMGKMLGLR